MFLGGIIMKKFILGIVVGILICGLLIGAYMLGSKHGKSEKKTNNEITNIENKIFIDIYCILKYGISVSAVAESLKKTIKYSVEDFTGMIVDTVNIHVVGVRV
jgi:uncharacterized alkaline shock family protein YloU